VIACLLDDSSLLALGKGYPALSGFIVDAAAGRAHLSVPALCLCAAESQRPGIAEHIGMLPVDIEPLELSAVIPAGKLIGTGVDWRIAHAGNGRHAQCRSPRRPHRALHRHRPLPGNWHRAHRPQPGRVTQQSLA